MKVTEHINKADKTLFSFEILPPLKGVHFEDLFGGIKNLLDFNPAYINVTYHQQEVVYKELGNGLLEKRNIRKRPGTVGISAALQFQTGVDVVPHLICGGFTKEETENALIDLHYLGINNILLIRGDAPNGQKYFQPEPQGHAYAIGLVDQVNNLNQGKYLDPDLTNNHPTDFCIGIAGYPEKHSEAPNLENDMTYLKAKVEAGAEYIVTQLFYDNQKYFDFVDQCRKAGIEVPVIPGLKPISGPRQLTTIPQTFHIDIPDDLVREVRKCKDSKAIRELGIEWTTAQCKELVKAQVPALHFFTMGKTDNVEAIVKRVL
jgi:methylenetetrahydrofolate reductase (NADPH)